MQEASIGVVRFGRQGVYRMVWFLLFFLFLHLIGWNRTLIVRRGSEFAKIDSSSKTADCSVGAALLLWAKMN